MAKLQGIRMTNQIKVATRNRKRAARAMPAPDDWPDGQQGGVWREDLMCGLQAVRADLSTHVVELLLCEGQCTDMTGAICLALDIDPNVRTVITRAGGREDTRYMLSSSGWVGFRRGPA